MSGPRKARDHSIKRGGEQVKGKPVAAELIGQVKHAAVILTA